MKLLELSDLPLDVADVTAIAFADTDAMGGGGVVEIVKTDNTVLFTTEIIDGNYILKPALVERRIYPVPLFDFLLGKDRPKLSPWELNMGMGHTLYIFKAEWLSKHWKTLGVSTDGNRCNYAKWPSLLKRLEGHKCN